MTGNELQDPPGDVAGSGGLVPQRAMLWLAAFGIACTSQAAWVGATVLRAKTAMRWDPSQHSMWGWAIWSDITTGNWLTFLYDSYRQVYWPPLHSWAMAAAMLVFGPSIFTVGLVSLVAYVATGVLLAVLARRAQPGYGGLAAAVTLGLWLTAGNVVNRFATEAYTEMPAIAVTGVALLLLSRAFERGTRSAWLWAGGAAMATYLTKTDYGIILMLATLAGTLLAARAGSQREPLRKLLPWAAVIAILAALWFAYPAKITTTIAAVVLNRSQGPPPLSLAGLTYHIVQLFHWTDGAVIGGLLLLAFGVAAFRPRTDLVRVVALYVALALLLHTVSATKSEKHIVKVVPWLFLLTGILVARLRASLQVNRHQRPAVAALAIAVAALAISRVSNFLQTVRPPGPVGTEEIVAAIAERVRPEASHVMIGGFGQVSPHYIHWTVLGNDPSARVVPDPMTKTGFTREAFQDKLATLRLRAPLLRLIAPAGQGPTYRIAHVPTRRREEPIDAPAMLERMFTFDPDRIFVLTVEPGSRWDTEDYRSFQHAGSAFVPQLRAQSDLLLTEVLEFTDRGVRLFVFDRRRN